MVRAHTRPSKQVQKETYSRPDPPKWEDHALIFDCESRITADQTLTFGFWHFCELRDGQFVALEEGIFLDDGGLSEKEIEAICAFVKSNKAETADDGCDRIRIYSRSKFIAEVLGMAIQAKAFIVCFNAGFDLSRIAVDWKTAKNGGWSLVFSQWRDPKTPQGVDPNKCTLITSFSSERDQWVRSKSINVHDPQSRVYELANEYDGRRAVPTNFFMLLKSYQNQRSGKHKATLD